MRGFTKIARIGTIKPLSSLSPIKPPPPLEERRKPRHLDALPEDLRDIAQLIGDKRAMRIWKLWQRGVIGTLPELCAYDYLESHKAQFDFQTSLWGGRRELGGAVADFMVFEILPNGVTCWRIQGVHWHSRMSSIRHDAAQREKLLRSWYHGMPIVAVCDLWEDSIYEDPKRVFELAMAGEEIPRWQ